MAIDTSEPARDKDSPTGSIFHGSKSISVAGLIFIYISACLFVATGLLLYQVTSQIKVDFYVYVPAIIMTGIAVFCAILGVGLVRAAGLSASAPTAVINPVEWSVISDEVKGGNEEAITQYIRLTSLTGFTGAFTKLGLQGLPLATIGLTLFFSLLYLKDAQYMDLAKLTLGAFIGSFVQKQVGNSGGTVKLPSGEKIKVTTDSSSPV